jgi:tetratricopeptide (TPR) repeat protein
MGKMGAAEAILRRSFELPSIELSQELNESAWPMFLLARGRTEDALSASRALVGRPAPLVQALGHLLAGRCLMALHRMREAADEGDQAVQKMRASGTAGGVLVPEVQLTQGEFLLRSGQGEKGRVMLREAVAKLRADPGPDAWFLSLFRMEAACRLARDAGDWALATELAGQMREYNDAYAGTRYAIARAAEQQGDRATAKQEYQAAIERWREADPDLADLADARKRLLTEP